MAMPTPEYVVSLRQKVGHEMLWLTTAMGVVLDADGRILLCRRADTGDWTPPGGIIDPAEHPADAAVREVFEETGVIALPELLTGVTISQPLRYDNGDQVQYLEFAFRCRAVAGQARVADSESTAVGWYEADALPPLGPGMGERIARALDSGERAAFTFSGFGNVLGQAPAGMTDGERQ
jgi:ADP-ribose pyrophosphatase YjhB (NUDIX family)